MNVGCIYATLSLDSYVLFFKSALKLCLIQVGKKEQQKIDETLSSDVNKIEI